MIVGERIKQARELRGLTQTELARRIGVNQSAISHIENGTIEPSENLIENIVLQTSFPLPFFRLPVTVNFAPGGSLLFRAKRSTTARERQMAFQYARTIFEMVERLEKGLKTIPVNLPRTDKDPLEAARLARETFQLSLDAPISHLIHCLEMNGIIVLALPLKLEKLDAFCAWAGKNNDRPVIAVQAGKATDRLRFSIAHELGHLVMHEGSEGGLPHVGDDDAFAFAAEFLMPSESMKLEIIPPVSLFTLAKLKPKWKVSIQALIRRAKDLKIITTRQYSYLVKRLSVLGWRTREPSNLEIPPEKPRMLSQVAELIYGKSLNYRKIAHDMCLPVMLVQQTIEEHAGVNKGEENDSSKGQVVEFNRRENEVG